MFPPRPEGRSLHKPNKMTETEAQDEPVVFLEEPDVPYGSLKDQEPSLALPTSQVIACSAGHQHRPAEQEMVDKNQTKHIRV